MQPYWLSPRARRKSRCLFIMVLVMVALCARHGSGQQPDQPRKSRLHPDGLVLPSTVVFCYSEAMTIAVQ